MVLLLLVDNLSLSELHRLHATQTTVPFPRSSSFESLLLQLSPVTEISWAPAQALYTFLSPKFFPWTQVTCVIFIYLRLISRYPASLRKQTESLRHSSASQNLLILCAPPQIFIVAKRTRSDLAISPTKRGALPSLAPTHFGVTTSKPKTSWQVTNLPAESFPYLVHNLWLFFTSQISLRPSGAISLESHLIWRITRKPVPTPGKPEITIIYSLFLPEVILSHN